MFLAKSLWCEETEEFFVLHTAPHEFLLLHSAVTVDVHPLEDVI